MLSIDIQNGRIIHNISKIRERYFQVSMLLSVPVYVQCFEFLLDFACQSTHVKSCETYPPLGIVPSSLFNSKSSANFHTKNYMFYCCILCDILSITMKRNHSKLEFITNNKTIT